jgi:hypothetical protein
VRIENFTSTPIRTETPAHIDKYSILRAILISIELSAALRNELIGRRMPGHYHSLSMSANLGNFCKCPPILADSAKIGGYFQRFSRLADSCRNCQNSRTFAVIVKFDAHLQRLPSVADSRVITKAMTLCGIKKDCAILAFEIQ